ncbi:type III-B CRISPR module-associated Cmr3 family protein [Chloroflexus sp.]|uniref:type III-B CRISPR module-associated Cmr3 family protein n=1 Tax=Chloroflexus sp. TaxID=1904827 RepID=UPI002ACE1F92|nr:type III-B CRISPR module-associated Cmr3 family protein [Chloroflexus sp.]
MIVRLEIEALAPLAFPERKPGTQFNRSLDYIPGAAIFGALGQILGKNPANLPLLRAIRCHNAYPAYQGDLWVHPLPATVIQPKGDEKAFDSLYQRVCWEQQQPAALIYAPTSSDGRPWEAAGAKFYSLRDNAIAFRKVQQRMQTRVGINRRRGIAQDERLYTVLAIRETMLLESSSQHSDQNHGLTKDTLVPTRFLGSLVIPDGAHHTVVDALHKITHLGGRQTTGLGAVAIRTLSPEETSENLLERIDAMTKRFRQQAKLYQDLGGNPWSINGHIFTVNLLSDAILLEDRWIPTQEFSTAQLKAITGIEATLIRSFTTTKTVGGYHTQWHRPKPTNIAVSMGSVYVFKTKTPLETKDIEKLAALQHDGIGERRQEGYGQVRICDEFHLRNIL